MLLVYSAAAAFTTLPRHVGGFSVNGPSALSRRSWILPEKIHDRPTARYMSYGSNNNNNNNGGGGFLDTITNAAKSAAKSVLPSSWFQSEKEKQAAIERKRVQKEVSGGIQEVLKDAPLPIRMMGSMFGPLVSSAMSTMAESLAEQQSVAEDYLSQARQFLQSDPSVTRLLGEPIQVGSPFSQSSSSSSINGRTSTRIELGFAVQGSRVSGVAQLSATEAGIQRLIVQAQGRQIDVNLSSTPYGRVGGTRGDDDIIEAEIVEKDTRPPFQ